MQNVTMYKVLIEYQNVTELKTISRVITDLTSFDGWSSGDLL